MIETIGSTVDCGCVDTLSSSSIRVALGAVSTDTVFQAERTNRTLSTLQLPPGTLQTPQPTTKSQHSGERFPCRGTLQPPLGTLCGEPAWNAATGGAVGFLLVLCDTTAPVTLKTNCCHCPFRLYCCLHFGLRSSVIGRLSSPLHVCSI